VESDDRPDTQSLSSEVSVKVYRLSGEELTIHLPTNATGLDVKNSIFRSWGLKAEMQKLLCDDVTLEDTSVITSLLSSNSTSVSLSMVIDRAAYERLLSEIAALRTDGTPCGDHIAELTRLCLTNVVRRILMILCHGPAAWPRVSDTRTAWPCVAL